MCGIHTLLASSDIDTIAHFPSLSPRWPGPVCGVITAPDLRLCEISDDAARRRRRTGCRAAAFSLSRLARVMRL
jgi:hypothetical protein